jgi:hypothetical protein
MEDVWRRERSQGRRGAADHNAALLGTRVAAGVAQAGLPVAHVELAEPAQHDQVTKKKATKLRMLDRKKNSSYKFPNMLYHVHCTNKQCFGSETH